MKSLVIGYGNSLRGDDGVGPLVARQVADWQLPDVRSRCVHQLVPELAADIADVERVFFVDACLERESTIDLRLRQACLEPIEPAEPTEIAARLDHLWCPSVLLHLAKTLYGSEPVAYQILIPAIQFEYGTSISAIALDGLTGSLATLKDILTHSLPAQWEDIPCMKSV